MFEQSFVGPARTKTKYTVVLSVLLESTMIGVAVLMPLIYTSALPARQLMFFRIAPAPPPSSRTPVATVARVTPRPKFDESKLVQPSIVPRKIAILQDAVPVAISQAEVGVPGGFGGPAIGVITDIISQARKIEPPPPPAVVKPKPAASRILPVGGQIQKSKQIYAPLPAYPPLARQQRIAGVVKLTAIIGKDGAVEHLTAVSGHPLLIPAALDAVSKWRYSPTLLNGEPVEVVTEIDVHFMLSP
jgi:periplasmic protein TonB